MFIKNLSAAQWFHGDFFVNAVVVRVGVRFVISIFGLGYN
ncbi:hypothetical protein SPBRAN_646 [uncultured Candidatus Thioglobus sp.]|nr:hypothetical protein SPBRAN_646 [uncultured Candidatus Thioglobus sp.]